MKRKIENIAFGFAIGNLFLLPIGRFLLDASTSWAYFMASAAIFMLGVGLIIDEIRKLKP